MQQFEDLHVWQEGGKLYDELHKIFEQEQFRHYHFKDQILRAALSITNNIAEGYERQTNKELVRFLYIAKGSCGEVRSMLYRAKSVGFIDNSTYEMYVNLSRKISIMLNNLIKSIYEKTSI